MRHLKNFVRFWLGFFRTTWTLSVPFILLILVSTWLFFTGHRLLADAVSTFGSLVIVVTNLVYLAFSRKRV